MNDKRIPLVDEEPKYKKKSKHKGQPRSKHKHIYETVLLIKDYHIQDIKTGKPQITQTIMPTKVCVICGRIDEVDRNPSYYVKNKISGIPFLAFEELLSEKALNLPKWYAKDYRDKYATKINDD